MTRKAKIFWPLLLVFVTTDCASKDMALEHLEPRQPLAIFDSVLRFTLVQNPDAAFGTDLGPWLGRFEKPALILMMLAVVAFLARLYWQTPSRARLAAVGFALAFGGALGNLIDRFRYQEGVVDFIDVGLGANRFWIFNLADTWVFLGAIILGLTVLREHPADPPRVENTT
jgi:signal peptidase II